MRSTLALHVIGICSLLFSLSCGSGPPPETPSPDAADDGDLAGGDVEVDSATDTDDLIDEADLIDVSDASDLSDLEDAADSLDLFDVDDATDTDPVDSDAGDTPITVTLSGAVQKGPFVVQSTVAVSPVDSSGNPLGQLFSTQTVNDLGEFSIALEIGGLVSIEGSGFYYNEITGLLSDAPITLRAYFDLSTSGEMVAYINLVTHLIYNRIRTLVAAGTSFVEASGQAESELVAALPIGPASYVPSGSSTEMNILGGDSLDNAYLFAISAVLLEVAKQRGGGLVDAVFQELLNRLALDFAPNGEITAELAQEIRGVQISMSSEDVMTKLEDRLDDLGSDRPVPDLDLILDVDFDGVVNADDCLPRDSSRWTGHADLDADGEAHWRCGGSDCDDNCFDCTSDGVNLCGVSRDHDCDGAIDEWVGCGAGVPGTPTIEGIISNPSSEVYLSGDLLVSRWDSAGSTTLTFYESDAVDTWSAAGSVDTSRLSSFAVVGETLIGVGESIVLVNLADPANPVVRNETIPSLVDGTLAFDWRSISAGSDFVALVGGNHLAVIDLVNPSEPIISGMVGGLDAGIDAEVFVADRLAVVASGLALVTVDLSDLTSPIVLDRFALAGGSELPMWDLYNDLFVRDDLVWLTSETEGLAVFDITDPESIVFVHKRPMSNDSPSAVRLAGELYVSETQLYAAEAEGLLIFDATDPTSLVLHQHLRGDYLSAKGLFVHAGIAAVATGESGVLITDLHLGEAPVDYCGNSVLEAEYGEACDGDAIGDVTCEEMMGMPSTQQPSCTPRCKLDDSPCWCGDGNADWFEDCDDGQFHPESGTCQALGYDSGSLRCTADCRFDTAECSGTPSCGDGSLSGDEECDGTLFDSDIAESCEDLGFFGGELACHPDMCVIDDSRCFAPDTCGDGMRDDGEVCDQFDFGPDGRPSCSDFGFDYGEVECEHRTCQLNLGACGYFCGDGMINEGSGEECDSNMFLEGDETCASVGLGEGTRSCTDDCLADNTLCSGPCSDECTDETSLRCAGDSVEECQSHDGCLIWVATEDCTTSAPNATCELDSTETPHCVWCGDSVKNNSEDCDDSDFGETSTDCADHGAGFGEVHCDGNCDLTFAECATSQFCGNDVLNTGEECDGTSWGDVSGCEDLGFGSGALDCTTDCRFETAACAPCADECGGVGLTRCDETTLQLCETNELGCLVWADAEECGSDETTSLCIESGGAASCTLCGNGRLDWTYGEECDGDLMGQYGETCNYWFALGNGNLSCSDTCHVDTSDCDGVRGACFIYDEWICIDDDMSEPACDGLRGWFEPGETCEYFFDDYAVTCGNGVLDRGEPCDHDAFEPWVTCEGLGYLEGDVSCRSDCTIDTDLCVGRTSTGACCYVTEAFEADDGCYDNLRFAQCTELGGRYYDGRACHELSFEECGLGGICGNGFQEPNEPCDGEDFGVRLDPFTCESLGLGNGSLSCGDDCELDTNRCGGCNECDPGERRCAGTVLQSCVDESSCWVWQDVENCAASGALCGEYPSGVICGFPCGNGILEPTEACETGFAIETTCEQLNLGGGAIDCDPITCQLDLSGCSGGDIGIACATEDDCTHLAGGVCITDHPGGYCSTACASDDQCPDGSHCAVDSTCVLDCTAESGCVADDHGCWDPDDNGVSECVPLPICDATHELDPECTPDYAECLDHPGCSDFADCSDDCVATCCGSECDTMDENLCAYNCVYEGAGSCASVHTVGYTMYMNMMYEQCAGCDLGLAVPAENCSDGSDNDGDGLADCDDTLDCNPWVRAESASCNDRDDNCNGAVDENFPILGVSCDGGYDTDLCREGTAICFDGSVVCSDETPSIEETCDHVDNDCDGLIDEIRYGGELCDGEDLDYCDEGVWVCDYGTGNRICNDETDTIDEICDNEDNDCDGTADNFPEACTSSCGTGQRICRTGEWSGCDATAEQDCYPYAGGCVWSEDHYDCVGACTVGGQTCADDTWTDCSGAVGPTSDTTCDCSDAECDGIADEDELGVVLFVVDRSGSARNGWDDYAKGVVSIARGYADSVEVGLLLYGYNAHIPTERGSCHIVDNPSPETLEATFDYFTPGAGADFANAVDGAEAELTVALTQYHAAGVAPRFVSIVWIADGIFPVAIDTSAIEALHTFEVDGVTYDVNTITMATLTMTSEGQVDEFNFNNMADAGGVARPGDRKYWHIDDVDEVMAALESAVMCAEHCDGVDNDCDGVPDENPIVELGRDCIADGVVGECVYGAVSGCSGGELVCQPAASIAEACDGLDNDCDDDIDEDFWDDLSSSKLNALPFYASANLNGSDNADSFRLDTTNDDVGCIMTVELDLSGVTDSDDYTVRHCEYDGDCYTLFEAAPGEVEQWVGHVIGLNSTVTIEHDSIDCAGDYELSVTTTPVEFNVTAPASGGAWSAGDTYSITWTSNLPGDIMLEPVLYWSTQPATFHPEIDDTGLPESTLNDGSLSWTIPDLPMDEFSLRFQTVDQDAGFLAIVYFEICNNCMTSNGSGTCVPDTGADCGLCMHCNSSGNCVDMDGGAEDTEGDSLCEKTGDAICGRGCWAGTCQNAPLGEDCAGDCTICDGGGSCVGCGFDGCGTCSSGSCAPSPVNASCLCNPIVGGGNSCPGSSFACESGYCQPSECNDSGLPITWYYYQPACDGNYECDSNRISGCR